MLDSIKMTGVRIALLSVSIFTALSVMECSSPNIDNRDAAATNVVSADTCLFDITGFELSYLQELENVDSVSFDKQFTVAEGLMTNGFSFYCKLFVCDSWGYHAVFERDGIRQEQFTVDSLLRLFSILPKTPNEDQFSRRLIESEKLRSFFFSGDSAVINLSDEDEFIVTCIRSTNFTKVEFDLTSYD